MEEINKKIYLKTFVVNGHFANMNKEHFNDISKEYFADIETIKDDMRIYLDKIEMIKLIDYWNDLNIHKNLTLKLNDGSVDYKIILRKSILNIRIKKVN